LMSLIWKVIIFIFAPEWFFNGISTDKNKREPGVNPGQYPLL